MLKNMGLKPVTVWRFHKVYRSFVTNAPKRNYLQKTVIFEPLNYDGMAFRH